MIPLSLRQRQILLLLAFYSDGQIAHELGISRQSVKRHKHNIYRILDVPDLGDERNKRLAAVVLALRRGDIGFQDLAEMERRQEQ